MKIELNGTVTEVADGTTLLGLIEACAGNTRGSAVVVDGMVVPRGQWPAYLVDGAQRIELITAVQGG
ncbi:MAG TPA: sulfur carrier protein ThiS [Jatrophihabitantaceae bacterium]|jgi:sulfur carrier protein